MSRRGKTVPEYWVWAHMLQRCENRNDAEYKNYGARGISVCPAWHEFTKFFADMGPRPTKYHTLERKNNNLGYDKKNCRWATQAEQNRNHRRNRWIEHAGGRWLITELSLKLFNNRSTISQRLYKGWSLTDALEIPLSTDKTGWETRRLRSKSIGE